MCAVRMEHVYSSRAGRPKYRTVASAEHGYVRGLHARGPGRPPAAHARRDEQRPHAGAPRNNDGAFAQHLHAAPPVGRQHAVHPRVAVRPRVEHGAIRTHARGARTQRRGRARPPRKKERPARARGNTVHHGAAPVRDDHDALDVRAWAKGVPACDHTEPRLQLVERPLSVAPVSYTHLTLPTIYSV